MKKALFVATVVKTHIMVFHLPFLKMLQEMGYETAVAARNDYDNKNKCNIPYCDEYFDILFERSPFSFANIKAYRQLRKIIGEGHYDIIHCHTPVGGVLARLAARGSGAKVIYTAHGFHFYKGAPLLNWLVYFPIEWLCAWLTDVLITINQEDYALAQKYMHAKQVFYIPGVGIDLEKFNRNIANEQKKAEKCSELGLNTEDKILLSVGELNKNKNQEIVIRALAKINNPKVKYFIAGEGNFRDYLLNLIKELGLNNQVKLLGYRTDILDLLAVTDLFVFPSHREGLSVSLMEAIACKVPVICSNIRGNKDLVVGSSLFNQNDVEDVKNKILSFLFSDCLAEVESNYANLQKYSLGNVLQEMRKVYEK